MFEAQFIKGLLASSSQLSALVLFSSGLCLTIIFLKLLKIDEFKIKDILVPLKYFWIVAVLLTAAHFYLSNLQVDAASNVKSLSSEKRKEAWVELTAGEQSPLLFRSMKPRHKEIEIRLPFIGKTTAYVIEENDNTLILSLIMIVGVFLSVVVTSTGTLKNRLVIIGVASFLMLANWSIGAHWAVATAHIIPK